MGVLRPDEAPPSRDTAVARQGGTLAVAGGMLVVAGHAWGVLFGGVPDIRDLVDVREVLRVQVRVTWLCPGPSGSAQRRTATV